MQRDMELVREILFEIEKMDVGLDWDLPVEGRSKEEVHYHLRLLWDAGLIEAQDGHLLSPKSGLQSVGVKRLTWYGHEFLDAARSDTVWRQAREVTVSRVGSVTFEVLKEVLAQVARRLILGADLPT